jgi:pimeloyl-ACP methyl ester carboxylesterase
MFEYCLGGDQDGDLLVFHPGTLSVATEFPWVSAAAAARGLRTAICSRPGYGGSTRHPGRTVADAASDAAELATHLDAESFFAAGWSGGGTAALACAALLPDRVRACITLAGPAPLSEVGDSWMEWHSPSDLEEIAALVKKPEELASGYEEEAARSYSDLTAETLLELPGFAASDIAALRGMPSAAKACARSMRLAAAGGALGWLDDDIAWAKPWGFLMADIVVPVVIRHGDADGWVPMNHGRWLADHIPDARLDEVPGGGHMSVGIPFEPVVTALLEAAR